MQCPKCQFEQEESHLQCPRCGIVFEDFFADEEVQSFLPVNKRTDNSESIWLVTLLRPPIGGPPEMAIRTGFWALFLWWGIGYCLQSMHELAWESGFWHLVNLPFHIAGSLLFSTFGAFAAHLGGTLGQLLMPIIVGLTLLMRHQNAFGASICGWWLGQNFLDIAPYINDASVGALTLLGATGNQSSDKELSDWYYLLNDNGWLYLDHNLGHACMWLGRLLILAALVWGGCLLRRGWLASANLH